MIKWINRFHSEGIDGLVDRPRVGAPRQISKEKTVNHVISLLDDPGSVGEEHWTAIKRGTTCGRCFQPATTPYQTGCLRGRAHLGSSMAKGAVSEKIVPSGHDAHAHPEGIAEIRRILLDHLGRTSASRRGKGIISLAVG